VTLRAAAVLAISLAAVGAGACVHESPSVASAGAPPRAQESACHHALPSCAGPPPTYTDDVRPILERRCFKCHAGEGAAADEHDFSQVQTLRAQKVAFASEISTCAMPPAPESPIADAEAEVMLRWVACGGVAK
jgi:uncharacterized membrane protein